MERRDGKCQFLIENFHKNCYLCVTLQFCEAGKKAVVWLETRIVLRLKRVGNLDMTMDLPR